VTPRDATSLLAPFLAEPARSVVLCDFDGTLSPIVDDPAAARLLDGAAQALVDLADRLADVVVVSGRPVHFLEQHLPTSISLVGLYGLEGRRDGRRWEHPGSGAWREVVEDLGALASVSGPSGMRVESKGLSITLHYRGAPQVGPEVLDLARLLAERGGLEARPAKMSVELHPPVAADKGTVVERIATGTAAAMFLGDDRGDLPAFDGLDRLAATGTHAVRAAVRSAEAPEEMLARADLVLDGPVEVLSLLRTLAA